MTDRELLELAAKAAEIKNWWDGWSDYGRETGDYWNPLTNDGDALRLAVKLGIEICPDLEVQEVSTAFSIHRPHLIGLNVSEAMGNDPCAAARRAIVRSAAKIGKLEAPLTHHKSEE